MSPAANSLNIGMGVEGAAGNFGLGTMLQDQVTGDTEEERKKRMQQVQQQKFGPAAASIGLGGGYGAGLAGVGGGRLGGYP